MIAGQKPVRKKHPFVFPSILIGIGCAIAGGSWWAIIALVSDKDIFEAVTFSLLLGPVLHATFVAGVGIALLGLGILIHRVVKQKRMAMS